MKVRTKKILLQVIISLCHGTALALATLYLLSFPILFDEEVKLNKFTAAALTFSRQHSADTNELKNFFLVNTEGDLQLLTNKKHPDQEFAVTNRHTLIDVFKLAAAAEKAGQHIRAIVIYSFLGDRSAEDPALKAAMSPFVCKTFLVSIIDPETKEVVPPIFKNAQAAPEYYYENDNRFLRIPYLCPDGSETLSLLLFKKLSGNTVQHDGPFLRIGGVLCFSNFLTHLRIWNEDIGSDPWQISGYYLCQDATEDKAGWKNLTSSGHLDGRILLAAPFGESSNGNQDAVGKIQNPLVFMNAYLDLVSGATKISSWMFPWFVSAFAGLSYLLFFTRFGHEHKKKPAPSLMNLLRSKLFHFNALLFLISCINYLCFGTHINIVIIGLYISAIVLIKKYRKETKFSSLLKE
jgi:hypothetical protein